MQQLVGGKVIEWPYYDRQLLQRPCKNSEKMKQAMILQGMADVTRQVYNLFQELVEQPRLGFSIA